MLQNSYINTLDKSDIEAINKLKSQLCEKSNMVIKQEYINLKFIWEEDISLYLPDNFVDTWHEFSKMRNMVAHNKPICKELEKDICSKIEELNGIMDSFKNKINEDLKSIEKTNIQKKEKQLYYEFECEEAGISPLKDAMHILSDIYESEKWYSFWNKLEDYLISYKNSVEDLSYILDNLLDELNENLFQNCSIDKIITNINLIYKILEFHGLHIDKFHFDVLQTLEENPSLISVILNNLTDLLTDNNSYISIDYSLDNYISDYENILFEFKDLNGNYIKITYIGGDINLEHGTTDDIDIKLFLNDECLASGKIEISYGDYEMNFDQGYNMPTMEDELNIDLKEVETIIEEYFNTRIEQAEYYYGELEEIIEN
ncbi:hypothetical protein [Intestinibacter bartlettii]|uniref:hypothetical protein n=1 Tax=Intestinibacter bartlettii TaxID=261299 RepID=UPI0039A17BC6